MSDAAFHLGQLRHLYLQMLNGVTNTKRAATGLLGPAITGIEGLYDSRETLRARITTLEGLVGELVEGIETMNSNLDAACCSELIARAREAVER